MICKRNLKAGQARIRKTDGDCRERERERERRMIAVRQKSGTDCVHSFLDPTSIVSEIIEAHKH
jgi:hypothetical protein